MPGGAVLGHEAIGGAVEIEDTDETVGEIGKVRRRRRGIRAPRSVDRGHVDPDEIDRVAGSELRLRHMQRQRRQVGATRIARHDLSHIRFRQPETRKVRFRSLVI